MSKKTVGGDYLLDLSSIEIEKSEDGTKTNITDADVLKQLTNLKNYVPNPNGIKPVWIKMKNGENNELVVARGTFANVDTGEFEICVQLNGYKLIISIEFTQALNEDEQPIDDWYIDTNDAKYLFTSDAQNVDAIINEKYVAVWNGSISQKEGLTFVGVYCKVVRNFKELQFIMNFRMTNNSEDAIEYSNDSKIATFSTLPDDILEKIYAHNGENLKELTANMSVAYAPLFLSTTGGAFVGQKCVSLFWINHEKKLSFYLENGAITIPANTTYDVESRISLAI